MKAAPVVSCTPGQLQAWAALERRNQRCRANLTEFVREVVQDESGDPVDMNWPGHHVWHRHLDYCWSNGLRCLIMAPMSHGKSLSLVVGTSGP